MITGILLAAGYSRRFGNQKLLQPLSDNSVSGVTRQPMGLMAAQKLLPAVDKMVVVIRLETQLEAKLAMRTDEPKAKLLQELYAKAGIQTLVCQNANIGMSESIKAGVKATADSTAWLIALADMPFIQTPTIAAVAKLLRQGRSLVRPAYQGKPGHPVGFSQTHFEELMQLQGDRGAQDILHRHKHSLTLLPCEDRGVILDIDTPAQLQQLSPG